MSSEERIKKLRALVRLLVDTSEMVIHEWEVEDTQPPGKGNTLAVPSPDLFEARRVMLGACGLCIDLVQDPLLRLTEVVFANLSAKALSIAVDTRIADVLAHGDPLEGVSAAIISQETGIGETKLSQLLRCLSTLGIFTETKNNHFANTPTSQYMVDNEPLRCWLLLSTIAGPAAEKLPTVLSHFTEKRSSSSQEAAFQVAYGTTATMWEWLEEPIVQPDGSLGPRPELGFVIPAMVMTGQIEASATYADYPWEKLGSRTIVDIGGGVGGMSLELAKRFPNLNFLVQDREVVIREAEAVWLQELPATLHTKRVHFMAHDFFSEQPVKGADVYVLRHILHDWPDDACVEILRHVRRAMEPDSLLLVVDKIINTAASSPLLKRAPSPLPSNYGYAQHVAAEFALLMMTLFNGQERTAEELSAIVAKAGLRLVKVWECRGLDDVSELRRDDYVGGG